jgi:hypothetical protein
MQRVGVPAVVRRLAASQAWAAGDQCRIWIRVRRTGVSQARQRGWNPAAMIAASQTTDPAGALSNEWHQARNGAAAFRHSELVQDRMEGLKRTGWTAAGPAPEGCGPTGSQRPVPFALVSVFCPRRTPALAFLEILFPIQHGPLRPNRGSEARSV